MKTTDRDTGHSLSQAETAFKKYANEVIKMLDSNGVVMEKDDDDGIDSWSWHNSGHTEDFAQATITISYNYRLDTLYFYAYILFPNRKSPLFRNDSVLKTLVRKMFEEKICKKYPLTQTRISVTKKNPKIPAINTKEIANQLYTAMLFYQKKDYLKATSMIKRAEKKISKFLEKEADIITESFFK